MRTFIMLLAIVGIVWLGFTYFSDKPLTTNINLEKKGIARCEEGMKTMKFKSSTDADNWYLSCVEGLNK